MHRHISAILISCLLLQFTGCYSNKYLSKEEMATNYLTTPVHIITKENKEFIINQGVSIEEIEGNTSMVYCSEYNSNNDTLILFRNNINYSSIRDEKGITAIKRIEIDSVLVPNNLIDDIYLSELNVGATVSLIVIVGIVGSYALLTMALKNIRFNF